jgi:hypothetical protein
LMYSSCVRSSQVDIDPRSIGAKIEYSTVQNIMSLSRGITNINPSFDFAGVVIKNAFDSVEGLAWRIAKLYASQAAVQALKVRRHIASSHRHMFILL